jgi:integrase/recombinase XerD
MTYAFARIGAVVSMRVEDYFANGKRWWVRLHEKGGKRHEMPAHHNAWRMIQRRSAELGLKVKIGCHTFRATGITAYLEAGGTLENAQLMAAHESPRTTKLYDRTGDEITLDEVERIAI